MFYGTSTIGSVVCSKTHNSNVKQAPWQLVGLTDQLTFSICSSSVVLAWVPASGRSMLISRGLQSKSYIMKICQRFMGSTEAAYPIQCRKCDCLNQIVQFLTRSAATTLQSGRRMALATAHCPCVYHSKDAKVPEQGPQRTECTCVQMWGL